MKIVACDVCESWQGTGRGSFLYHMLFPYPYFKPAEDAPGRERALQVLLYELRAVFA